MKIEIDYDGCVGHGQCEHVAPEVFHVNDDGLVELLIAEPPEELREKVESAVALCPATVIRLIG